jgi:hypothetical protein
MEALCQVAEYFASGRVIDAIVVFMSIECALLIYWRKKSGRRLSSAALVTNLAAGAALLLSLRAALLGSPWQIIAFWLALAFLAHLADLKIRWAAR